jgi:hypothetical protein
MKILFIIGLIFLCINVFRFLLANIQIFKLKEYSLKMKIWNLIESIGICVVLAILIKNYYNI